MADISIRTRKATAGLAWLQAGLRLFARRPFVIIVLVAFGPLLNWTIGLLPIVGTAFALILFPTISLGMLSVCRAVDEGAIPGLTSYLGVLRDRVARWELLKIGVYYSLVIGVLVTLWSFLPSETAGPSTPTAPSVSTQSSTTEGTPTPTTPANPNVAPAPFEPQAPDLSLTPMRALMLLTAVVILVPLQMTIWFAPILVAWHAMPATKALFFSFFACWRNRAAMVVYLLALFGLACIAVLAFAALVGLLNAKGGMAQLLLAPPPLLMLAITQTSTYAMYRDLVANGPNLSSQHAPAQEPSTPG